MSGKEPVLVVETPRVRREVFLLQPGQRFEGFGGAGPSGFVAGAEGAVVVRQTDRRAGVVQDMAYPVDDPTAWRGIRHMIREAVELHGHTAVRSRLAFNQSEGL